MKLSIWLFGLASAAAGLLDLIFREFEPAHQPIQAWGDHIPGVSFLALVAGLWLVAGGIAVLTRSAALAGAVGLAVVYGIFCLFPLPRLISAPHYLGHTPGVYIGVFMGVAQQIVVFVGAACLCLLLLRRSQPGAGAARVVRWVFGLCSVDFGMAHFINMAGTAKMIPGWMPFGAQFWAGLTGVAFIAAGLAIVSGVFDVLAARLLGVMLILFSALVLAPGIFRSPHSHMPWGSNAYNLTAAGAAWVLADYLAGTRGRLVSRA